MTALARLADGALEEAGVEALGLVDDGAPATRRQGAANSGFFQPHGGDTVNLPVVGPVARELERVARERCGVPEPLLPEAGIRVEDRRLAESLLDALEELLRPGGKL